MVPGRGLNSGQPVRAARIRAFLAHVASGWLALEAAAKSFALCSELSLMSMTCERTTLRSVSGGRAMRVSVYHEPCLSTRISSKMLLISTRAILSLRTNSASSCPELACLEATSTNFA